MNTIFLSRTELEEIIMDTLNLNAQSKAFVGECIGESEFYSVANDIIDAIIESQDDYDEEDLSEDDEEFEFDIYDDEAENEEYEFDDD